MQDPIFLLSPPRSFSSVVSTMIGEHPQIYGFPELHLLSGNLVEDIIRREEKRGYPAPPGLIRTIAQEHDGIQNSRSIIKAIAWLRLRKDWSTKKLFDYLLEIVSPKIGLEKSPQTANKIRFLQRCYTWFPKARFIHLTRHPLPMRSSLQELLESKTPIHHNYSLANEVDRLIAWYSMHYNIVNFMNTLPVGQGMRIKGEDLLSYPDLYLPQIADWLGLRTDKEAIEAMKHPENSPYAYVGIPPAKGGNDMKFLRSPKLRQVKIKEPSLTKFFAEEKIQFTSNQYRSILEESGLKLLSPKEIADKMLDLAYLLGYE